MAGGDSEVTTASRGDVPVVVVPSPQAIVAESTALGLESVKSAAKSMLGLR